MPVRILMPALSPTMTEGNLVKWCKKEGDLVKDGDVLAEIETDKATMEIEVVDGGVLCKILVPEGTEAVKVNTLIGVILEEGEDEKTLDDFLASLQSSSLEMLPKIVSSSVDNATTNNEPDLGLRIIATPLAKRIAKNHHLDLRQIHGTGPSSRITKADVEAIIQGNSKDNSDHHVENLENKGPVNEGLWDKSLENSTPPSFGQYQPLEGSGSLPSLQDDAFYDIAVTGMRTTIARRLTQAKQTIPHFYLSHHVKMKELMILRQKLNTVTPNTNDPDSSKKTFATTMPTKISVNAKISVNDFVLRACALALMDHQALNASWHDSVIRYYKHANIAVAVAIDGGLITPIVEKAELKSLTSLSKEVRILAQRAKEMKLKPHESQGGSFSVSNLGMYGTPYFNAIINPPQVAILAIGAISDHPIAVNGQVVIEPMMNLSLSIDHRAVDGAQAAQFLQRLKEFLENPFSLLS